MGSCGFGCESWSVSVGVVSVVCPGWFERLVKLELWVDVGVCWSEGVEDHVTVNSTGFCVLGDGGVAIGVVLSVSWGGCIGVGLWISGVVVWFVGENG